MKNIAACGLLLCSLLINTSAGAATADDVWQDYQKHSSVVGTQPRKAAVSGAGPRITVEARDGASTTPTTPQKALEQAEVDAADVQAAAAAKAEQPEPNTTVKEEQPVQNAAAKAEPPAQKPVAQTEQSAPKPAAKAGAAAGAVKPAVLSKPKPKPKLVKNPPLPRVYMRTPQPGDFSLASSQAGGYSLLLPTVFGTDALSGLPALTDAMLVRSAANDLLCAATVLDSSDTASYNATAPLPDYEDKRLLWRWQHGTELVWSCSLSRHVDFYGDKMLLEAGIEQNGRTYQLLYVFPAGTVDRLLPQALQSLDSFQLHHADSLR